MAQAHIQLKGREALQRKLNERRERMLTYLNMRLLQLAEDAVVYSMENKGYKDRTANLKNSISFALYLDGKLVTAKAGRIPKPNEATDGQQGVENALEAFAKQDGVIAPKGYSLIVVAGMNYGKYVEDKGYNVLYLTKYYLKDEMKKVFEEAIEIIKNGG